MSEYTPKAGDKVRATLGETVLVGQCQSAQSAVWSLRLADSQTLLWLVSDDGWRFERIQELPTKFGAVIRRADGVKFIHVPDRRGGVAGYHWYSRGDFWHSKNATLDGFTVLFEGVDE